MPTPTSPVQGVASIDTPSLVIDLDAMDRNIARMAAFALQHQVRWRPHAKMHKSATLALRMVAAGAVGVCVQKTAEAEAMAAGGVRDIYISNEVIAAHKLARVASLARSLSAPVDGVPGRLAIAVDSAEGIGGLGLAAQQALAGSDTQIDVFIEIDVGHGRCGIAPGAATLPLARQIVATPHLRFAGLQAYHGRAQHLRSAAERRSTVDSVLQKVRETVSLLEADGIGVPLVTGAGTGTMVNEAASGVYGELQAGSFLFMDADYAANAADPAQPPFEHALFVKTQVVSVSAEHAVCDAGHKSHAIDSGLPRVHRLAGAPALRYENGGDEHGIVQRANPAAALPGLGEILWLIPGHCDPTVNLYDTMIGVRGGLMAGQVQETIRVDARGALT